MPQHITIYVGFLFLICHKLCHTKYCKNHCLLVFLHVINQIKRNRFTKHKKT